MKARLVALAALVLLSGCAVPRSYPPAAVAEAAEAPAPTAVPQAKVADLGYNVYRMIDKEAGVACWVWNNYHGGGISCISFEELPAWSAAKW